MHGKGVNIQFGHTLDKGKIESGCVNHSLSSERPQRARCRRQEKVGAEYGTKDDA